MSRSYRKTPILKEKYGKKDNKKMQRWANKKVRKTKNIPDGMHYKKVADSYNICDYYFRETWDERKKAFESEVKAYLNGQNIEDPRDENSWRYDRYIYINWYLMYKRK